MIATRAAMQLRTGLMLLVEQDESLDEVCLAVHIDVGFTCDPPNREGLSHLVEHLLFDVDTDVPFAYGTAVAALGGRLNAQTFESHSCYWTVVPPLALARIVDYERRRWSAFAVRQSTFAHHLAGISEEVAARRGVAYGGFPWPDASRTRYGRHGRAIDGLGTPSGFAAMTMEDAVQHHRKWYHRPGEMVVSVCGPDSPERALDVLSRAFENVMTGTRAEPRPLHKTVSPAAVELEVSSERAPMTATVMYLPAPSVDQDLASGLAVAVVSSALEMLLADAFPDVRFSASAGELGAFTSRSGDVIVITAVGWPSTPGAMHDAARRLVGSRAWAGVADSAREHACSRLAALRSDVTKRAAMTARMYAFTGLMLTVDELVVRIASLDASVIQDVAGSVLGSTPGLVSLTAVGDL